MAEEKQLTEMQNELKVIAIAYGELVDDFGKSVDGFRLRPELQFWRRMVVHTLFASVEAATFYVKQMLLVFHAAKTIELSTAEVALLKEENYQLKSNGKATVSKAKLGTLSNLKFTFILFYKVTGTGRQFDTGGSGFHAYQKALVIRDKITHPKNLADINVGDDQVHVLQTAMTFIKEKLTEVAIDSQYWSEQHRL